MHIEMVKKSGAIGGLFALQDLSGRGKSPALSPVFSWACREFDNKLEGSKYHLRWFMDGLLLQVTAPGKNTDSVSRSFAPKLNVIEDPVCGSGHCHIVPYWAEKLKKENIVAYQASKRGGMLYCRMAGNKVFLSGKAALFSECELYI